MLSKVLKIIFIILFISLLVYSFVFTIKYKNQLEINDRLINELNYYTNLNEPFIDKRDSIEYNIIKRDSIITIINNNFENEKERVETLNNNSLVIEFKELVWSD